MQVKFIVIIATNILFVATVSAGAVADIAEMIFKRFTSSEGKIATETVTKQVIKNYKPGTTFRDCDDCPEMVVIPAGSFLVGSATDPLPDPFSNEKPMESNDSEKPQHRVQIKSFAIGKYEVTQEQYYALMGVNPSYFKGRTLPVEEISWKEAQKFVKKLSAKTGKNYRLPSEAEWEYAARAGSTTVFSFGNDEKRLAEYAWFSQNSRDKTHSVGLKKPNAFGLYDMHGNVWEWTQDCWNDNYVGAPTNGSAWTKGDCSQRVVRGGSWIISLSSLRSASRYSGATEDPVNFLGFRVARDN